MTPTEFAALPVHKWFDSVELSPGYVVPVERPIRARYVPDDEPECYMLDGELWIPVERADGSLARVRL